MKLLLVLCFVVVALAHTEGDATENHFRQWMTVHQKVYATAEEYSTRLTNFKDALHRVAQKNKHSSAKYAINKFSDLSTAEFKEKYLMKTPVSNPQEGRDVLRPTIASNDLPTTYDWRDRKVVSPVKDQGQCGSCWAFSVVENLESVWMLTKNMTADTMPALAPQQLVDCSDLDLGCNGGNPPFAYQYVLDYGLETNADYPYTASGGSCDYNKADTYATMKTWKWATSYGDETTLQQNLVSWAPLSICVDASNWQDYSSGVLSGSDCCWACMLDHCVQLVGYNAGASAATPYWIVRNSWGTDWGVNGYIWVEMGKNSCGLTDEATSTIVA